jgi:hypothetical protein
MSTPSHMRRFFPNQERAEILSNGTLVWLQEIIKDKNGDLVVKRILSNQYRPLHEKYDRYDLNKIREMNTSLGVYYGGLIKRKKNKRSKNKRNKNKQKSKRQSKNRSKRTRRKI